MRLNKKSNSNDDEENIQELLDKIGYGYYQWLIITLSCLICFVEGANFTLMSVIIIPVEKYFNTTNFEAMVVSSIIFVGVGFGSVLIGFLTKTYGRIPIININLIMMSVFLLISVFIKNIIVYSLVRMIIGFNIGVTLPTILNILCEYLPTKNRSLSLLIVWSFFPVGNIFNLVLVIIIMPNYESENLSQVFLIIGITMTMINLLIIYFINDSPRNLINEGKEEEGIKIYKDMFRRVNIELSNLQRIKILDLIKSGDNKNIEHSFWTIFQGRYTWITINFTIIWLLASTLFYGPILIYSPTLRDIGVGENKEIIISNIISALVSGIFMVIFSILSEVKIIGLKNSSLFCYILGLLFGIIMIIKMDSFEFLMAAYLSLTGTGFSSVTTIAVTTYPTKIRDFALGYLYSTLRLGGFISQFIFLGFYNLSKMLPYYTMLVMNIIIIISMFFIKIEPTGIPLDRELENEKLNESYDEE